MATKHGLGRGLDALIRNGVAPAPETATGGAQKIAVKDIKASSLQPRRRFDEQSLGELADSIRHCGVLQPLLVRRAADGYELIAGERRWRAATAAGVAEVPAIVMEAADHAALEMALVENLQRENLNVLEEADGYRVLADRFAMTQEQIAQRVGKSRAAVANVLRILDLPGEVKEMISADKLSAGHAKILAGLEIPDEQLSLAKQAVSESFSVRQLEKIVQRLKLAPRKPRATRSDIPAGHVTMLCDKLYSHFGTAVRLSPCRTYANGKKAKGTIEIDFYSNEDLDRILQILGINAE